MPIFRVAFSLCGAGLVELPAQSEEDAEKIVENMTLDELVENSDFSLEVTEVSSDLEATREKF